MSDLTNTPEERIGKELYDEQVGEMFTVIGVDNGEHYECEYVGGSIRKHRVDYLIDEIGYRFNHPESVDW